MTSTVVVPTWLFVLILLFAVVTAATHLLFPSVRWFFRRRAERVVAEINKRLERPIQPFKLLRRQDMLRRVLYDPKVMEAVTEHAAENKVREDVAFETAERYAREIVPSFSATAYFSVAIRLARWLSNLLFDVHVERADPEALAAIEHEATVVFVINHRSNMDYVLVTWLAAEQSALSYAVGEWARVWPLSRLIRAMGAYFIRRRAHTRLYRRVLASYVEKATAAGVTQAVFPEGGLSRTGAVGAPKLGILSYIVEGWRPEKRDVVFVPVALNYDRVVEDRILVAAARSEKRRFRASAPEAVHFSLRYLWRRMLGRVDKFGTACVCFGAPVRLADAMASAEGDPIAELGDRLTRQIRETVPVVRMPLLLLALQSLGGKGTEADIAERMDGLLGQMQPDVPMYLSDTSLSRELDILVLREVLGREGDLYSVHDEDLVNFYARSIAHHFPTTAIFVAT